MKVVFLGTPEFACPTLEYLLNEPEVEVLAIITQPDRPAGRNLKSTKSRVKVVAEEYILGLGRLSRKPAILTPANVHEEDIRDRLRDLEPDIAVVVAYGQILKEPFLKYFPKGAVNIHASLLPKYRGAAPIAWSILNGDGESGVTLQKIASKLDAGDIIAQQGVKIGKDWDAPRLYKELSIKGAELMKRSFKDYFDGVIKPVPQNPKMVSYARKITKEDGRIQWDKPARYIAGQIRALTPWPGTFTTRNGKLLKILRATALENIGTQPGLLVGQDKFSFYVQCGDNSALKVLIVQPESRARMPASEYMKGHPFVKGDVLGT